EDGIVEKILPAAGELAPSGYTHRRHHIGAAETRHQRRVLLLEGRGLAEAHRAHFELLARPQQTETRFVVVTHYIGRDRVTVIGCDLGRVRLDHEVADGQHE